MGEDPRAIREQVEQTRERMGDTVEALAYKADVKTRAKDNIHDKTDRVKEFFGGAAETVGEKTPSPSQAAGVAKENPLGLAIGAAAVGFVAGLLIPSTRVENEKIGDVADQVKGQISEAAQTAVEHGKEAATDAAQAAKEAATDHAQQAKEEVTSS